MWLSSGCQELRRWEQERSVRGCKRASCGILWLEMICVFSTVSVSINIRTVIWGYSFIRCYHGGNWGQESWISLHWLIYISVFWGWGKRVLAKVIWKAKGALYVKFKDIKSWVFPGGSDGKASAYNARDLGLIPGSGRFSGEGNGNPLQYSCLKSPMEDPSRLQSMGSQRVGYDLAI